MEATIGFRVGTDARSFFFPAFCQTPPVVSVWSILQAAVCSACSTSLCNLLAESCMPNGRHRSLHNRRRCCSPAAQLLALRPATAGLAGIPHARRASCGARRPCYLARLPRGRRRAPHDGSPATQGRRGVQGGGGARLVAADTRDALAERRACCGGAEGGRVGGGRGREGVGVRGRSF